MYEVGMSVKTLKHGSYHDYWLEITCARKNDLYHKFVNEPSPENKAGHDKNNEFCAKHVGISGQWYNDDY